MSAELYMYISLTLTRRMARNLLHFQITSDNSENKNFVDEVKKIHNHAHAHTSTHGRTVVVFAAVVRYTQSSNISARYAHRTQISMLRTAIRSL